MERIPLTISTDCRHYRGNVPCKPHKQHGVYCDDCEHYDAIEGDILIIKLGAMGDVMRTTPILHRIKESYPAHRVHWLTDFPDAVPREPWVDFVYPYETKSLAILENFLFSAVYCLDKDREAAVAADRMQAELRFGWQFIDGAVQPVEASRNNPIPDSAADAAYHKWATGLFDEISKQNEYSYQEEIFAVCGFDFEGEEYIVRDATQHPFTLPPSGTRIGLNTGCGGRWTSRLWPEEHWVELIAALQSAGLQPVLLGGPEEHEKNLRLHEQTNAPYFGVMPLQQFDSLLGDMDVVVTAVTMAMHLAIGRQRRLVLLNNIFNRNEFELYGRGEILEPEPACKCYYAGTCPHGGCMQNISPKRVFEAIQRQLSE